MGAIRKAYRILVGKPLGKGSARLRKRWGITLKLTV
jgi:hypothetical protein